jgi:hypothetical protein
MIFKVVKYVIENLIKILMLNMFVFAKRYFLKKENNLIVLIRGKVDINHHIML